MSASFRCLLQSDHPVATNARRVCRSSWKDPRTCKLKANRWNLEWRDTTLQSSECQARSWRMPWAALIWKRPRHSRISGRRVKLIGATLSPLARPRFAGYFELEKEAKRQALNRWIPKKQGFDVVIDLDLAVRDPADPAWLRRAFDSSDPLPPATADTRSLAVDPRIYS
jgi:hypothetical protein